MWTFNRLFGTIKGFTLTPYINANDAGRTAPEAKRSIQLKEYRPHE